MCCYGVKILIVKRTVHILAAEIQQGHLCTPCMSTLSTNLAGSQGVFNADFFLTSHVGFYLLKYLFKVLFFF